MNLFAAFPLALLADASAASNAMRSYVGPLVGTMIGLASIAVVFFLVWGGIQYMTSAGNPEKLEHAKKILKNALIGLVLVIAAGTLTAILTQAYNGAGPAATEKLPELTTIESAPTSGGLTDVLVKAIVGLLQNIIESAAKPFLAALDYFTKATPLMAENSSVFNLWLALVGIADVLFVVVVALLGFHVMSFATFGLDEIEFKHLLPRLGLIFLLVNTSIFAIDAVIGLSNAMIRALQAGFPSESVWNSLIAVVSQSGGLGLAALLIMVTFLILSVMLLVYYVLRLVTLYLGAVLAPLVFLIWLLPAFKDFAETAIKVYITTIFVLFVHVVILQLAASIFGGMAISSSDQTLNPIMSMVVGVATILALLKTQGVMSQMSYVSLGPKTARKLGGQLSNVVSHYAGRKMRSSRSGSANSSGAGSNATVISTNSSGKTGKRPSPSKTSYSNTTRPAPKVNASQKNNPDIDYPIASPRPKPKAKSKSKKMENE